MKIIMPNNYRIFLDGNKKDYDERLDDVNRLILTEDNINYFNHNWDREVEYGTFSKNQTKEILDKTATYLLSGKFKEYNILSYEMMDRINKREIPVSNTYNIVNDILYSSYYLANNKKVPVTKELTDGNYEQDIYNMTGSELKRVSIKNKRRRLSWRRTRSYRMWKLFSTPQVETYRVEPVTYKGKDGKKRPVKDIQNRLVFDSKRVTIGGHKGIISNEINYVLEWQTVDVDNYFTFLGKKYRINDFVNQYKVFNRMKPEGEGRTNNYSNKAIMDKILCFYNYDTKEYKFFDMDIYQIDNSMIKTVEQGH